MDDHKKTSRHPRGIHTTEQRSHRHKDFAPHLHNAPRRYTHLRHPHRTGTGRLRVPCNRMPRRTTLHDASETVARRIRRPNQHHLRRSLRQRKRFRRRGEKLRRQGRPSVPRREGYNRQTSTCSRRDHDPQAVLVDATRTVSYRGAIDDNRYEPRVKHHYLRDALLATHTNTSIPVQETPAFGCTIHLPEAGLPTEITYSEHIAPVLQKNCQTCHRHGEVAPFTLIDYSDAKAWATEIAEYTQAGLMPPWKPASGYGDFKNSRQLTDTEIQMIAHWVEAGAPAGDLDAVPPAPEFPEGWALGEPDWIAEMPVEYEIEPEGADEYRQFIIPTSFETDMYVQSVDVQPGNRKTVHHVIAYLDVNGEARKLDAQDPKPGYVTEGTGPGFDSAGTVGGWAPGITPLVLPEGVGYLLPKGADIVMQVHYYRTGHLERDRSRLGLYFSKTAETTKLHIGEAINSDFVIPAGEKWHEVLASKTFKRDVYLLATMPHMHLLGRDMRLVATTPSGDKHDLIWIQDWDFNWQDVYHYRQPLFLPAGTVSISSRISIIRQRTQRTRTIHRSLSVGAKKRQMRCVSDFCITSKPANFRLDPTPVPLARFVTSPLAKTVEQRWWRFVTLTQPCAAGEVCNLALSQDG